MCKIAIIAGLKPENVDNNWAFIQELGVKMSKGNDDGLGYTALDKEGNLFGERWLINDHAFEVRTNVGNMVGKFGGFLKGTPEPTYNSFGKRNNNITAITLHTRAATSARGLANTHPFVDLPSETSVIHNGIINNITKEDNIRSTCDSERILNRYLVNEIALHPERFQSMVDELKGYFACGIFSKDAAGKRIIDVFKTRASLDAVYVKELKALVITTNGALVKDVCKEFGFSTLAKFDVEEDVLLRLDATTGAPMLTMKYNDTTQTNYWNSNNKTKDYSSFNSRNGGQNRANSEVTESQKVISLLDKEINKTNSTIRTVDPMNEAVAAREGYMITAEGVWVKRKAMVN